MVEFHSAVKSHGGRFTKHGIKMGEGIHIMAHVKRFRSERALARYTRETENYFPLEEAKENNLMRSLLRSIHYSGSRKLQKKKLELGPVENGVVIE